MQITALFFLHPMSQSVFSLKYSSTIATQFENIHEWLAVVPQYIQTYARLTLKCLAWSHRAKFTSYMHVVYQTATHSVCIYAGYNVSNMFATCRNEIHRKWF